MLNFAIDALLEEMSQAYDPLKKPKTNQIKKLKNNLIPISSRKVLFSSKTVAALNGTESLTKFI